MATTTAAPTFSNYSTSASYKDPGSMTVAGGALWYVESSSSVTSNFIAKMTTSGTVTDYTIGYPSGQTSFQIADLTTGPDGNVWFAGYGSAPAVGKLDTSTGAVTFYGVGKTSYDPPSPLAVGSDGNLYFAVKYNGGPAYTYVQRLDPTTGTVTTAYTIADTYVYIADLATGSDGRIWLAAKHYGSTYAYALSISGTPTLSSYYVPGQYRNIVAGPDGNLWLSKSGYMTKLTTSGTPTQYAAPSGVDPNQLAAGPDGAVWFVDKGSSTPKIGRITTSGSYTTSYTIPGSTVSTYGGIVLGPDNAIWFDYRAGSSPWTYNIGRLGY